MAKDLPYFKFFCSEWTDGDITLESLEVQGLFINICSYYWSNECDVNLDKLKKKFRGQEKKIDLLIGTGIIKIKSNLGEVIINFLDEQRSERNVKSKVNSLNGAKGGRPKKPIESENKPNALNSLSETKGIKKRREEKREEEKERTSSNGWFQLFQEHKHKSKTITEKASKQLKQLIKNGHNETEFKKVCLSAFNDEYHIETKFKYLTFEFLTREDKFIKFLEIETTNIIAKPKAITAEDYFDSVR